MKKIKSGKSKLKINDNDKRHSNKQCLLCSIISFGQWNLIAIEFLPFLFAFFRLIAFVGLLLLQINLLLLVVFSLRLNIYSPTLGSFLQINWKVTIERQQQQHQQQQQQRWQKKNRVDNSAIATNSDIDMYTSTQMIKQIHHHHNQIEYMKLCNYFWMFDVYIRMRAFCIAIATSSMNIHRYTRTHTYDFIKKKRCS